MINDILILTYQDSANTGWRLFKCAQRAGLKVMALKGAFHPFYYPEQIPVHPAIQRAEKVFGLPIFNLCEGSYLKELVENSKIIHFTSSTFINTGVDLTDKNVIVNHSGRDYRLFHDKINPIYNKFVSSTVIQTPDLLGFGANDEHLIYFPVDTEFIKPNYTEHEKLRIGHFPSGSTSKGSEMILKVIADLPQDKFEFHGCTSVEEYQHNSLAIWHVNLRRMANCDVIIDTIAPTMRSDTQKCDYGDKFPYGEWGNTSMEAAALGKIVITNSHKFDVYKKTYGRCELVIANNEDDLRNSLEKILALSKKKILEKKMRTRKWVEMKHSLKATAEKMMISVYGRYLK